MIANYDVKMKHSKVSIVRRVQFAKKKLMDKEDNNISEKDYSKIKEIGLQENFTILIEDLDKILQEFQSIRSELVAAAYGR